MKLYRVGKDLVPRLAGHFAVSSDAGRHAHKLYELGLNEEDNAFYLLDDSGNLQFYCSIQGGFGWETPSAEITTNDEWMKATTAEVYKAVTLTPLTYQDMVKVLDEVRQRVKNHQ